MWRSLSLKSRNPRSRRARSEIEYRGAVHWGFPRAERAEAQAPLQFNIVALPQEFAFFLAPPARHLPRPPGVWTYHRVGKWQGRARSETTEKPMALVSSSATRPNLMVSRAGKGVEGLATLSMTPPSAASALRQNSPQQECCWFPTGVNDRRDDCFPGWSPFCRGRLCRHAPCNRPWQPRDRRRARPAVPQSKARRRSRQKIASLKRKPGRERCQHGFIVNPPMPILAPQRAGRNTRNPA